MIYLDTCLVIYAAERDPVFGDAVIAALSSEPDTGFAISPLVKLECLVKPIRSGDVVLRRYYEKVFGKFVEFDAPGRGISPGSRTARAIQSENPDALHLACAEHHGCEALSTNDDRLAQAGHRLARNVLNSFPIPDSSS